MKRKRIWIQFCWLHFKNVCIIVLCSTHNAADSHSCTKFSPPKPPPPPPHLKEFLKEDIALRAGLSLIFTKLRQKPSLSNLHQFTPKKIRALYAQASRREWTNFSKWKMETNHTQQSLHLQFSLEACPHRTRFHWYESKWIQNNYTPRTGIGQK